MPSLALGLSHLASLSALALGLSHFASCDQDSQQAPSHFFEGLGFGISGLGFYSSFVTPPGSRLALMSEQQLSSPMV